MSKYLEECKYSSKEIFGAGNCQRGGGNCLSGSIFNNKSCGLVPSGILQIIVIQIKIFYNLCY